MTYSDVDQLIFGLRAQITALQARVAAERWGIVTAVSPLTVLQDGDGPGHEVFPATSVSGLAVGDRVRVQTANLRTLVTGRSGGAPSTAQHGTFTVNIVAASGTGTSAITFQKPFPTIPDVQVTSGDTRLVVEVRDVTTTGFNIGWRNVTSSATTGTRTHLWRAEA